MCKTGLYPERSRAAHRVGPGRAKGSDPYLSPMRPVWFYVLLEWIPGLPRAPEVVACSQSLYLFPPALLLSLLLMPHPRACWESSPGCLQRPGGWVALGLAYFPLLCLLTTRPRMHLVVVCFTQGRCVRDTWHFS